MSELLRLFPVLPKQCDPSHEGSSALLPNSSSFSSPWKRLSFPKPSWFSTLVFVRPALSPLESEALVSWYPGQPVRNETAFQADLKVLDGKVCTCPVPPSLQATYTKWCSSMRCYRFSNRDRSHIAMLFQQPLISLITLPQHAAFDS